MIADQGHTDTIWAEQREKAAKMRTKGGSALNPRREPDWTALARSLYERRSEAINVPFVEKEVDGWKPRATECHRNADLYSLAMGGCRSVRGWIVFDYHCATGGLAPIVRFAAHSVLQLEDGSLIDITPSVASQRYPFLRHHGSDEEFEDWVQTWNLVQVEHVIARA